MCLEVIKDAVQAFGARACPVKEIIASLGPVLNGTNAPAREGAMALMVELSRWIGQVRELGTNTQFVLWVYALLTLHCIFEIGFSSLDTVKYIAYYFVLSGDKVIRCY